MLGDSFVNGLSLCVEVGDRLLAVDILPVTESFHADDAVPVVRSSNHHCINVLPRAKLAKIKISLAVLVAVFLVHGLFAALGSASAVAVSMVLVTVRDGNALDVLVIDMCLHHAEATISDTDETHDDPFAGCSVSVLAECA